MVHRTWKEWGQSEREGKEKKKLSSKEEENSGEREEWKERTAK